MKLSNVILSSLCILYLVIEEGTYRENCEDKMDQFLKRCFYHSGLYNSEEHFAELDSKLKEKEVINCFFTFMKFVAL